MTLKNLGVRVHWSAPDEDGSQEPTWDYPGLELIRPFTKAKFIALPTTQLIGIPLEYISMAELFPHSLPNRAATINHTLASLSRDFSDPKSETFGRPRVTEDACKGYFWFRRVDGKASLDRSTLVLMEYFVNLKADKWMQVAPKYQDKEKLNRDLLANLNIDEFKACSAEFIATYGNPETL